MSRRIRSSVLITSIGVCFLGGCAEDSPERLMMKSMPKAVEGNDAAALALLDHSLALAPNDTSLLFVRGGLHDSLGNPAAAIADYERAIELSPHLEPGIAKQLEYLREQIGTSGMTHSTHSTRTTFVPAAADTAGPTVEHITFCASRPKGYRNYVPQPDARYRGGDKGMDLLRRRQSQVKKAVRR